MPTCWKGVKCVGPELVDVAAIEKGQTIEKTYLAKPGKDETRMLCCLKTLLGLIPLHSRPDFRSRLIQKKENHKGFAGNSEIGRGD